MHRRITAMTIIVLLLLLTALLVLRAWATHDRFSRKSRPAWFD